MSIKSLALSVASAGGGFALARFLTSSSARILAYHGVDSSAESLLNFDGFHVRSELFERHLRTIRGHYQVVTLRSLAECFEQGRPPPPRAVAITFDDGYKNNLSVAARMLGDFCMPATFFVTTGFVDGTHRPWWFELRQMLQHTLETEVAFSVAGSEHSFRLRNLADRRAACVAIEALLKSQAASIRDAAMRSIHASLDAASTTTAYPMMSWVDVRQLQAAGHEIGAHTVSHISLGHESRETLEMEVKGSLSRIAEMTGTAPVLYSYPYGEAVHFTREVTDIVRSAGCIGGVTTLNDFNPPGTDPFLMRRLNVTGHHDRNAFRSLVSGFTRALRS